MSETEIDKLRRALERIRDYRPRGPVDEWSSAAAFREVQEIAADALTPGVREARIRVDEAVRAANRRRVGALERGKRYFYVAFDGGPNYPAMGAWVRFLKGDAERDGIAHVKVLELVGKSPFFELGVGEEFTAHVSNLQVAPGQPLEQPR